MNVFDGGGDGNGYRRVWQALIEGIDVGAPIGGPLGIGWDAGGFEAVVDGGTLVKWGC